MTRLLDVRLAALAAGIVLPMAMPALAQDTIDLRMAIWSANDAHLKLFNSIAPRYAEREGGYTRIVKRAPSILTGTRSAYIAFV